MVTLKRIILPALLLAGVVGWWILSRTSDEELVRAQLINLCNQVNKRAGEKEIQAAVKADAIGGLLADPCLFSTKYEMLSGSLHPGEITGLALRARAMFESITLSFKDIQVRLLGGDEAAAVFTAALYSAGSNRGALDEVMEVTCKLRKTNNKWLFTEFRSVEALEK